MNEPAPVAELQGDPTDETLAEVEEKIITAEDKLREAREKLWEVRQAFRAAKKVESRVAQLKRA